MVLADAASLVSGREAIIGDWGLVNAVGLTSADSRPLVGMRLDERSAVDGFLKGRGVLTADFDVEDDHPVQIINSTAQPTDPCDGVGGRSVS